MKEKKFYNYDKCISYLFELERIGIKYDLRNINTLLKFLNNPHKNFKSIHVAGTNGKGSVSSIINSVLIEKGFRTGLYTSPHIKDFRERILVDGKFISKKFILDFVNRIYNEIERIKPSFFEVTTALAFEYISYMKVDYAVIETGLGGRLDSTNVLKPILSVITSIDIDHTEFLGNKIESITKEKGGIIKKNVPVVVGKVPEASKKILEEISSENKSEIIFSEDKYKVTINKKSENGFFFSIKDKERKYKKLFFPVVGDYQVNNIRTSLASLNKIEGSEKINFDKKGIDNGLKNLKTNSSFYGRFELISSKPKIIIDVSHNVQGIKNIKSNLKYFKFDKLFVIFAMMSDKKFKKCINELENLKAVKIVLTKPNYKRATDPKVLYESVKGNKTLFEVKENVKEAFEYIKSLSSSKDLILITGSFFLVSDFLLLYKNK